MLSERAPFGVAEGLSLGLLFKFFARPKDKPLATKFNHFLLRPKDKPSATN